MTSFQQVEQREKKVAWAPGSLTWWKSGTILRVAGVDAETATLKEAQNNKKLTAKERKEAAAAKKAAAGPIKDMYGRGK